MKRRLERNFTCIRILQFVRVLVRYRSDKCRKDCSVHLGCLVKLRKRENDRCRDVNTSERIMSVIIFYSKTFSVLLKKILRSKTEKKHPVFITIFFKFRSNILLSYRILGNYCFSKRVWISYCSRKFFFSRIYTYQRDLTRKSNVSGHPRSAISRSVSPHWKTN